MIGTDRKGAALESYDLKGKRVQRLARPAGSVNDVDIRTGFSLGGGTVTLVGAGGRGMSFYRLDPAGRRLSDVGARRWVDVGGRGVLPLPQRRLGPVLRLHRRRQPRHRGADEG